MKLQLKEQQGVQLLSVEGQMDTHAYQVLKAGLTKLLKDGKNKLILEMMTPSDLDPAALQEMGKLNALARELNGEILLVIPDPNIRTKAEAIVKPEVIKCYDNKVKAFGSFQTQKAAGPSDAKKVEERDAEIKALKEQLKQKETGELSELKSKNAVLNKENQRLEEALTKMMILRKDPPDQKAYQEKMKILEDEVRGLNTKVAELESKAVKPK